MVLIVFICMWLGIAILKKRGLSQILLIYDLTIYYLLFKL